MSFQKPLTEVNGNSFLSAFLPWLCPASAGRSPACRTRALAMAGRLRRFTFNNNQLVFLLLAMTIGYGSAYIRSTPTESNASSHL
jgi:hypothetical protein